MKCIRETLKLWNKITNPHIQFGIFLYEIYEKNYMEKKYEFFLVICIFSIFLYNTEIYIYIFSLINPLDVVYNRKDSSVYIYIYIYIYI